jgi:Cu-processing system permease protein
MKTGTVTAGGPPIVTTRVEDCQIERVESTRQFRVSAARQIWLVAAREFSDRFRSGWVLACVLVWLGAIGLMSLLGLLQIGRIGMQGYERTVVSLLNLVQYLVPLLGLLLGHDLLVGETEEGTFRLLVASGVNRFRLFFGKFAGGAFTLAVPLVSGFAIAGAAIGLTTRDSSFTSLLRLATSGLVLGIVFLGIGVTISAFSRTRVQSLVLALLAWCVAVFVFDLVALGFLVSLKTPVAAHEIEVVCDATHVNAGADIHSELDSSIDKGSAVSAAPRASSLGWLALNPVDLFRAVNLATRLQLQLPLSTILLSIGLWLAATLGTSLWRLNRIDL